MLWLISLIWACGGVEPIAPDPTPEPPPLPAAQVAACNPAVKFVVPTNQHKTPRPAAVTPQLAKTRKILETVVRDHGRDPANPWAIGHAMLALGPDVELTNGKVATDWLFEEYAQVRQLEGDDGIAFPSKRGNIRIEPHTDLILKALTETGVAHERKVMVDGKPFTVGDLYRGSLCRAWVEGSNTAFQSWNDTPWALQGLATWAPPDLSWNADGGHAMTLDDFTHAAVDKLRAETAFMRDAMAMGEAVQKKKQGIFAYTCGGTHLVQGAAYAVARGFGEPEDRKRLAKEVEVMFWRLDVELDIYDQALVQAPEYTVILLEQRLKFLGHFLETQHKLAAEGLYTPDDAQQAKLERALTELIATVGKLEQAKVFGNLRQLLPKQEQMYLDFVGDAAHAIRGIDLATGKGTVAL